jgi:hypothetical protein
MKISVLLPSLLLAAALVASVLLLRERSRLQTAVATIDSARTGLQAELVRSAEAQTGLTARINSLQGELGETRNRLSVQEASASDLRRELALVRGQLAEKDRQSLVSEGDAANLREALALAKLEVSAAGADEIAGYQARIEALEADLAMAVERTTPQRPAAPVVVLPTTVPVQEVGPESAFVVLGFGANEGAQPNQLLEIRRGTESVATVLITGVEPHHAIAQVRPNTLRAGLHKGDLATITLKP